MNSINIGLFCNEYPPVRQGGIGTFTQSLARRLTIEGHKAVVFGISSEGDLIQNDNGVTVYRMRPFSGKLGSYVNRILVANKLNKLIMKHKLQLIEFPDFEGWGAIADLLKAPTLIRLHGSASYFSREMDQTVKKPTLLLEWLALDRANEWISVSSYTAQKTKDLFRLKSNVSQVIYNSVSVSDDIEPFDKENKTVVFVGSLVKKKGVLQLAAAWNQVSSNEKSAELIVYGGDTQDEKGSLKEQMLEILNPKAQETVVFKGSVSREQVFAALSSRPIAVFPSYAEAFAIAPLESMAMGCPTIYSSRGSGPEVIKNGEDGILIDPDCTSEIAEVVLDLLNNREKAEKMSTMGHKKIKSQFSEEAIAKVNIDFYRRFIERNIKHHGTRKN